MTGAEALPYPQEDPAAVEAGTARCRRLAAGVDELIGGLGGDRATLAGAWVGPAATSCRRELGALTSLTAGVVASLYSAAHLLRAHAAAVTEARARVDGLRREYDAAAARHSRELDAAPDLPGPLVRLWQEDQRAAHAAELARLHARHRDVLTEVREHGRSTARAVLSCVQDVLPARAGRAGRGPSLGVQEAQLVARLPMLHAARAALAVGAAPPPAGTPPFLVRAWWHALTPDEQARAVVAAPGALGSLAGLPAAVRSRVNEQRLAADVAALRARAPLTWAERRWLDTCLVVREQLGQIRARPDPLTRGPLVAQLLVFDPLAFDGQGRAAIAVGDLDTADHVAFLVPGLGSEVRGTLGGLTRDAVTVTTEARRASPRRTTATVAWLGYDAPGLGAVAVATAAEAGADLLAADVLAVQAGRDVVPHLTVIGHSYGSTTAGTALRDHVTGADDAVLVGSPGPNVETAADLHVPTGHVFVGASSRDPVSYLDRFGADPAHEAFGGYRFQAEDVTRHGFRLDGADHSKYFHAKTESLANIVRVVVGDYDALQRAPYRDAAWLLPDGINNDPEADRAPTVVP